MTNIKRHCVFQSTLLMRGATIQFSVQSHHPLISIHAPHARSDKEAENDFNQFKHFNPRSSCEERPKKAVHYGTYVNFNPRSSCEERHTDRFAGFPVIKFQSTLLMRGATPQGLQRPRNLHNFNPRSSCEERLEKIERYEEKLQFQSTLLMRGATA